MWKEAIQSKYKARPSKADSIVDVQRNRQKYSRTTSGRPVKRQQLELAKRDASKKVSIFFSTKCSFFLR